MWSLMIDCRCDTCIDGITRYQWPRIIAVQAPPRSAAELRKLAIVIATTARPWPDTAANACATIAIRPAPTAIETSSGRIEASVRPTVAQYIAMAAVDVTSAH